MTFSYSHFTNSNKWTSSAVNYTLTDNTRALAALAANPDYRYDAAYGVKAMGLSYATLIDSAFDTLLAPVGLTAFEDRGWTNISQVNITFALVKGFTSDEGALDGAKFGNPAAGNVVVIYDVDDIQNTTAGIGNDYQIILHEIGHALGLSLGDGQHPHQVAPEENYTHDNTIMSYIDGSVAKGSSYLGNTYVSGDRDAATPMIYDIATLQKLYGVKTTDVTDSYTPTGAKQAWTLWDGGTDVDTLDVSGLSWSSGQPGAKLDLRGGVDGNNVPRFMEIKDERIAIAFDPRHYTGGDITQPLLSGKSGVVDIEIAKGGAGNDTIIGGYVANTLQGGAGNDKVYDPSSKTISGDYLYGDTPGSTLAGGNDTLWGGSNTFLYGGGGANDNATCTRIAG